MPTPEIHAIILDKAKTCIETLQQVINVAAAGGVYVHEQLTGWEDVEAELAILDGYLPQCAGDLTTQIATLKGMLPSTSE